MTVLNYATFKPLVNDTFQVKLNNSVRAIQRTGGRLTELPLKLVEAHDNDNAQCERFTLIFRGPADRPLPQKYYSLCHNAIGCHRIFLVPVGEKVEEDGENRKTVGCLYWAESNRIME